MLRSTCVLPLLIALTACSKSAPPPAAAPNDFSDLASHRSVEQSLAAAVNAKDPCVLLSADEVAAVLGAPLAVPPYRATAHGAQGQGMPAADGDSCRYIDAQFHHIDVQLMRRGGARLIAHFGAVKGKLDTHAKGLVALADGTSMTGSWDEARILGCCELLALVGDSTVSIDVTGSRATLAQAGPLADAALARMDKGLAYDGTGALAAAQSFEAKRPTPKAACDLLSRADVEAVLGPLRKPPEEVRDMCQYTYAGAHGGEGLLVLSAVWRDGYWEFRQRHAIAAQLGTQAASNEGGDAAASMQRALAGKVQSGGDWDQAASSAMDFSATKKDVMVSVAVPGQHGEEKVRALIAKAMQGW